MERLTGILSRILPQRIVQPVIIRAVPGRLREIAEELLPYSFEVARRLVDRFFPVELPFFFPRFLEIPRFNMLAAVLPREVIEDYAEDGRVARIYPDRLMFALQYPTVPPEGIFVAERRIREKKKITFTSTFWTKKLIGADRANEKGYTGKGVKVAVLDTGSSALHEALRGRLEYPVGSAYPLPTMDMNGHGCLSGKTEVVTSICGLTTLENLWEKVDAPPVPAGYGELKSVQGYTVGMDGAVNFLALYRERVNRKVVIETKYGTVEATTWHKFFVAVPRRPRGWYRGYDVVEKEAKDLKEGDVLLCSTYSGQSWGSMNPSLAYLAGYSAGDGLLQVGHLHGRRKRELRLYDGSKAFLEELQRVYGGSLRKDPRADCYELYIYGKTADEVANLSLDEVLKDAESFRAWVSGFIDAEGSIDKSRSRVRVCNANKALLDKVCRALRILGVWCYVTYGGESKGSKTWHLAIPVTEPFKRFIKPYVKKRREVVDLPPARGKEVALRGRFMVKVKSVRTVETDEYFYDLSTSSRNYSAFGIITHNTWCAACVGGRRVIDDVLSRMSGKTVTCEGVAPEATVVPIKVLDFVVGMGSDSSIIKGVEQALNHGVDVLSMSLGGESKEKEEEEDPYFEVFKEVKRINVIPVVAAGNCLPGDTLVYGNSSLKPISEVKPGDVIYSFEGGIEKVPINYRNRTKPVFNAKLVKRKVLRVIENGVQPVFEVKTRTRKIKATRNHPFLCLQRTSWGKYSLEWRKLEELRVGDAILIVKKLPSNHNNELLSKDFAYFLGLFIGDGWMRRGEVHLCIYENQPTFNKVIQCIERLGYKPSVDKGGICIYSSELVRKLKSMSIGDSALEKSLPEWVFSLSDDLKLKLIEGYLDSDGMETMVKSRNGLRKVRRWVFESPNERLIRQFRHLLISLGIRVTNVRERVRGEIKIFNGRRWYTYKNHKDYCFDAWPDSRKRQISFDKPLETAHRLPGGFANDFFAFEQIREIKPAGEEKVYDIEVEGSHNFIAEGIVVHNSGPDESTVGTPGCITDVLTVGAYDPITGEIAKYSSRGPTNWGSVKPDCIAPGGGYPENAIDGPIVNMLDMTGDSVENRFSPIQGTSMATPHVAGLVALMFQLYGSIGRTLTLDEIKRMLEQLGHEKTNEDGWGLISWSMIERWVETEYGVRV